MCLFLFVWDSPWKPCHYIEAWIGASIWNGWIWLNSNCPFWLLQCSSIRIYIDIYNIYIYMNKYHRSPSWPSRRWPRSWQHRAKSHRREVLWLRPRRQRLRWCSWDRRGWNWLGGGWGNKETNRARILQHGILIFKDDWHWLSSWKENSFLLLWGGFPRCSRVLKENCGAQKGPSMKK